MLSMWWTCTFPHSTLICNAVLCLILSNVRRARRRTGEQIHSYRISTLTATGAQVVQTKTQTHYFKWINLTFHSEPIFDDIRERDVCIVSDSVSILTRFLFLPNFWKAADISCLVSAVSAMASFIFYSAFVKLESQQKLNKLFLVFFLWNIWNMAVSLLNNVQWTYISQHCNALSSSQKYICYNDSMWFALLRF